MRLSKISYQSYLPPARQSPERVSTSYGARAWKLVALPGKFESIRIPHSLRTGRQTSDSSFALIRYVVSYVESVVVVSGKLTPAAVKEIPYEE
jgi:hypothetical protein